MKRNTADVFSLPEGYGKLLEIDLQKDQKLSLLINLLALLIAVLAAAVGFLLRPEAPFLTSTEGDGLLLRFIVLMGGLVVYLVLHELVHGLFIHLFSGKRAKYGFTGLYAFAGSDAYFSKSRYLVIALAPIVVWGIVLHVLVCTLPIAWFWPVYCIQIANLSGAAGDLYVTVRFLRLPADILVQDEGVSMTVYNKKR